jgi:hypothetical protein
MDVQTKTDRIEPEPQPGPPTPIPPDPGEPAPPLPEPIPGPEPEPERERAALRRLASRRRTVTEPRKPAIVAGGLVRLQGSSTPT